MRIIILGSTGYLGSKLATSLVTRNHEVLCIKRESSSIKRLETIIEYIDFTNITNIAETLKQKKPYDCLINTACVYPRNAQNDMDIFEANFYVPLKILLTCVPYGIKKFVTIDTGLPNNFNTYSFSKNEFARFCEWYMNQNTKNELKHICNIKLENFYGKDEPTERFIPSTVKKLKHNDKILLTEGDQRRDFIYIEDAMRAITLVVEKQGLPKYMDLPLGTGIGVSIREAIDYLKLLTNSKSELCFGAIPKRQNEPDSIADCTKMKDLGIDIKYSWQDGFKNLL